MRNQGQVTATSDPQSFDRNLAITKAKWPRRGLGSEGFTFVELLIVVAILGVLVILVIPAYQHLVEAAKIPRCTAELRALEKDIYAYFIDNSALPNSLNDIGRGDLADPWGNAYQYNLGSWRQTQFLNPLNDDFDLYSSGPNGASEQKISEPSSLDDIVRAGDGGWVGSASQY